MTNSSRFCALPSEDGVPRKSDWRILRRDGAGRNAVFRQRFRRKFSTILIFHTPSEAGVPEHFPLNDFLERSV